MPKFEDFRIDFAVNQAPLVTKDYIGFSCKALRGGAKSLIELSPLQCGWPISLTDSKLWPTSISGMVSAELLLNRIQDMVSILPRKRLARVLPFSWTLTNSTCGSLESVINMLPTTTLKTRLVFLCVVSSNSKTFQIGMLGKQTSRWVSTLILFCT
jgi:hypothetical protein